MGRRPRRAARVPTIARHGRLKRYSAVRAVLKFLAAAVAVLLVSGGSVAAIATWSVVSSIQPSVTLANETPGVQMPDIDAIEGGVNLLLVGSDSRQGQDAMFGDPEKETATLNDVTMLLHISEDHSSATVVSFPRDLFVPIPACPNPDGGTYGAMSSQKINTTLSYGGLPCTVLTVEKLTGLSIPFAAEVQFNGVIELSNAVGGVDVCVGSPIKDPYTGLDLAAGTHNLQGLEALQFLRTRHGVGDGSDLGRISARAHAQRRQHAVRPDQAVRHRQGRRQQHDAVEPPQQPQQHGVDRARAERHPVRPDRVRAIPQRHRRIRWPERGAADQVVG
jgi:LCP family protein required for cell wall assembly